MGLFDHAIVFVQRPVLSRNCGLMRPPSIQAWAIFPGSVWPLGHWLSREQYGVEDPRIAAAQNFHRELREFTLAEFGLTIIRETDERIGPRRRSRDYNGDAKDIREGSEKYVKNAYLADSLTALEHGDLSDLEKPFSNLRTKGKRGTTDYERAVMAIRVETDGWIPDFFTTPAEEKRSGQGRRVPKETQTPHCRLVYRSLHSTSGITRSSPHRVKAGAHRLPENSRLGAQHCCRNTPQILMER